MSSRVLAIVAALVLCSSSPVLAGSILPARSGGCPACQRRSGGMQAMEVGQPVRNAAKAGVGAVRGAAKVAKAAVAVPARCCQKAVQFCQNRKPIRRGISAVGRAATGRGPILGRLRGRCSGGCCH